MKPFFPSRNIIIATAIAVLASVSFGATAQTKTADQIRVTGAASASAVPDQVSLQFSIEQYDQIVDLALAQGVTRVSQVRFEVSNQKDLYQRALADAFAAARDKAGQLAGVAQRELGSVLEITEQSYPRPVVFHMAEARMDAKSPSMPGEQQIEARLEVVFSLK